MFVMVTQPFTSTRSTSGRPAKRSAKLCNSQSPCGMINPNIQCGLEPSRSDVTQT